MLAGQPTDEEIEMVKKFAYSYITENSHLKPSIRRIYERENLNAEDMFQAIERTDRTWMHQHRLEQQNFRPRPTQVAPWPRVQLLRRGHWKIL